MGHGKYILDDNDEPQPTESIEEWGRFMEENSARRIVACDELGACRVSTVFLGLDHGFGRPGPPVLWETMIFGGEHDGYQRRYCSRLEAEAGHIAAITLIAASRLH